MQRPAAAAPQTARCLLAERDVSHMVPPMLSSRRRLELRLTLRCGSLLGGLERLSGDHRGLKSGDGVEQECWHMAVDAAARPASDPTLGRGDQF